MPNKWFCVRELTFVFPVSRIPGRYSKGPPPRNSWPVSFSLAAVGEEVIEGKRKLASGFESLLIGTLK
ncbi:hypothetical protein ACIQVK_20480 [Streptomyces sp. NPDC090493]|uniref:hypothetical protein n=1 Tax=Streptomyces sp. NPDC090493 TaxID=3365964 RepID=UPI0037FB1B14